MYNLSISFQSKFFIAIMGVTFIGIVISLLYRRKLSENLALWWIACTIMAVVIIMWDELLFFVTKLVGTRFGAIALSLLAFVFIFAMLIAFSVKVSTLTNKNRKLAQSIALLEQRVKSLEK